MSEMEESTRDDRARVEDAVFRSLHAQLRSKEKRPVLRASDTAVWVEWHGAEGGPLTFRIEQERWWSPATDAHAEALARRLLDGIREELRRSREG